MSSLEKLRELRDQICQKKPAGQVTSGCKERVLRELASLHTDMCIDESVSIEYTEKIFKILSILKDSKSSGLEATNV
jgi:midasin (ATPase involved in ribosome maturation)|tara:strand:- start:6780 stop:7010 length:231 start_codon:yes stop_codon:yes gene_type:complete